MHTNIMAGPRARLHLLVALGAASVALIGAGPAQARPKQDTASRGCAVENENGSISLVGVGTRIGLFVCGSDSDWHFGWLVNP
jgi:hypothetical protein